MLGMSQTQTRAYRDTTPASVRSVLKTGESGESIAYIIRESDIVVRRFSWGKRATPTRYYSPLSHLSQKSGKYWQEVPWSMSDHSFCTMLHLDQTRTPAAFRIVNCTALVVG